VPSSAIRPRHLLAALLALTASGCGGGAPLLHPAQVLGRGDVTVGAGLSGQPVLLALPQSAGTEEGRAAEALQERAIAPALAPWVSARIGIQGSNEAGLTYSGRGARLDARHAFTLNKNVALSLGLGGDVILAGRPTPGAEPTTFAGGGFDVPLLLGWQSTGGLYSGWIGPRLGLTWLRGEASPQGASDALGISAQHVSAGLVAGLRLGFRYVHVGLEIAGDFHHVSGGLGPTDVSFNQFSLTPAGALILSF